ncbi:MAG: SAM-dependent DNA methyltransferase [Candidatus Marinimicrobia bacterium]|nr:SAM-dependent DNA methyltransferase [Candidatus Neomarinimicrobiota bacterium]
MAENHTLDFKKQIWAAADKLRGNMDASEYKHVVLGLIFLKYISDKFKDRYQELLTEGEGFEEDKDEYTMQGIFYVPEKARWSYLKDNALTPEIGRIVDDAMMAIEAENKKLKGVLPKNYARPELEKRRLGEVINLFSNLKLHGQDEQDMLGRVYEYCLTMFAEQEGRRGGEFYTPACVVQTLVEVLKPYKGRVYDPACGSGGMFVQSANFINAHRGNLQDISVFGQESNPTTWKMCMMNLAIRGIEVDLGQYNADTFTNDQHKQLKADFVLANPPFNMDWPVERVKDDPRWKYGTPPGANANYAWMQHMIHHLAPNGKLGLVLANGSLSSQAGGEGKIRQKILEDDLVECIVAMPSQLFYTTQIPVCLWFISRNKKQKGQTLFIDARNMGELVTRKLRELTNEDIRKIAGTVEAWQLSGPSAQLKNDDYEDIAGFCKVATLEEIKNNDYILTPGRYVGLAPEEEDLEPFDDKMKRLTSELGELFEEGDKLQNEVKKQLKSIGFKL